MEWQPIESYDPMVNQYYVIIGVEGYATVGCQPKYWHDVLEGDYRTTSPMYPQPTHFCEIPSGPPKGD